MDVMRMDSAGRSPSIVVIAVAVVAVFVSLSIMFVVRMGTSTAWRRSQRLPWRIRIILAASVRSVVLVMEFVVFMDCAMLMLILILMMFIVILGVVSNTVPIVRKHGRENSRNIRRTIVAAAAAVFTIVRFSLFGRLGVNARFVSLLHPFHCVFCR